MKIRVFQMSLLLLVLLPLAAQAQTEPPVTSSEDLPRDAATSAEIVSGKVVWDISVRTTPKQFLDHIKGIRDAYDAFERFGVEPKMVFVFRGDSISWLSQSQSQGRSWASKTISQIDEIMTDFQGRTGVRMVADPVAGQMFKIHDSSLMSSITVVDNAFVELINYQARGYALIQLQ